MPRSPHPLAAALVALLAACGAAPAPPAPPPPRPAPVASAPTEPAAPPPRPSPPRAAIEENDEGIVGGPDDETSFEFDPESEDEAPASVVLDGTAAPPKHVVRALAPYLEARRARLAGMSARQRQMLVLTRLAETTHVHLLQGPGAARRQVTFGRDPVEQASFAPKLASALAYRTDVGGDEQYQISVLDLDTRASVAVPTDGGRHGPLRWSPDGKRIAYPSNARNGVDMDVYVTTSPFTDPPVRVVELTGQNVVLGWDRPGKRLLVHNYRSKTESGIRIVEVATGAVRDVPAPVGSSTTSASFSASGGVLYVLSDRAGDFREIFEVQLERGQWRRLTRESPWDVEELAVSPDGRTIVYNRNEDGASVLRSLDVETGVHSRLRNIPTGVISALRFVGPREIGMTLSTPTRPPDAYTYELETRSLTQWTFSEVGGLPASVFVEPTVIRYSSFDGLEIPALYYRPRGPGRFPTLLWMHGGPEDQSRPGFEPLIQYFVSRGVAVIAPNVRGSDGYGRRFLSLDDGALRHHAVRDVGALLDWVAARAELDAARVGIHGASYGGFMVLASLVEYGERLRAGCDLVGLSSIVTFLENTSSYRRELRRAEYGDERDPAIRAYLESISPLTQARRIRSPLFVAHGARDPRVPSAEAEQVVAAAREAGVDVWYMLAQNEGHAFRGRRTRDAFYRLMATFLETHLLADAPAPDAAPAAGERVTPPLPSE